MSMLARFKKGGGILELVKLVEESPEPKRSQLLTMIRNEDPEFAAQVESKLFSYEMLKSLPENIIAEIISATPAKILALALYGEESAEFITLAEKCVGKNFSEYKSERELVAGSPPNPGQVDAARKKIIAETRKLEAEGKIRLPFSGPEGGAAGGGAPKLNVGGTEAAPTGTASEDAGIPAIESFGIEAPPPGLSGERLETFLKTQLGG